MQHLTFKRLLPTASQPELVAFQQVFEQTFVATFGHNYSQADLDTYRQQRLSLSALTTELLDPTANFYGFWLADALVGYAKWQVPCQKHLTPALAQRYPKAFYLERFYFLEQAQGTGVAAVALPFALSHAKYTHQATFAYLTVWEHNLKAQHFYQNFGFRTLATVGYPVGDTVDREYLYGKNLTP
jgi:ribosomal protein S18 acetylase RimI-like enzyme